ncbi:MAG TPA: DHA2 family efflux MFS transporter permease subunit [Trinickia sp.]|uniref:DHA2 family efflux MFS transporter permease subunit n=1 Tax=Trinickia sp. TaxID=2571163 RepID=UPI002CD849A0|nr:DHA2 family efflux MFS transporter permease subunit [Trinickia sp.]HTI16662.1 DHA2 family efflux MFS transporter permease subunit [Trinickia sp.]
MHQKRSLSMSDSTPNPLASSTGITAYRSSLIIWLVAAAFFMENLDATIITTALPQMAHSFHVAPVDLGIGITAYLLTLAVFIPVSGWVADRFGVRTIFTSAIAVFTAASALCGMTHGLVAFTAARVVQGIGGSMMVPVGRLAVLRSTRKEELMRAIAIITWPGLVAPVIGPPLGGFITTYASWRWIFYLNVPLGLIGIALSLYFVTNTTERERRPFDWLGFMLCGVACTTLLYGTELIGTANTPWREACLLLAIGVASAFAALAHLRRARNPIVDLSAFAVKTFTVANAGGSLFRISISAVPFLLPLMFQVGFGLDAFMSGLLTLAVFAGNLSMKLLTTPVMRRFGFRKVLIVNGAFAAATLAAMGLLRPSTPHAWILVLLFISGLSRSLQFTAVNTLSFADVPKPKMSSASTLNSALMQVTMGMGVAFGALALRAASWLHGHNGAPLTATDFGLAFFFVGALGLVAIIDAFSLAADAGSHVSGHVAVKQSMS